MRGFLTAFTCVCVVTGFAGCGGEPETSAVSLVPGVSDVVVTEPPAWPVPEDSGLTAGAVVFGQVCYRCHFDSLVAPTIGDTRGWAIRQVEREQDGRALRDVFVAHTIEGFGDMRPRGGRHGKHLSDAQVAAGVDYMLWAIEVLARNPDSHE